MFLTHLNDQRRGLISFKVREGSLSVPGGHCLTCWPYGVQQFASWNVNMNFEEQCLDLCNVKTKANVDDDHNTTNNTEAVTPRISELMTDSDLEKQTSVPTEASETYLMPQLTDNLQTTEEDNQDTLEIDEVSGNKKSCAQDTPAVDNPTDLISSNDEQHKIVIEEEEVNMKEDKDSNSAQAVVEAGDDGVDMDIGVDLSLDESGVLEAESANATSISDNALNSKSSPQYVLAGRTAEGQANAIQTCSTEASAADQAGLYPLVEEGEEKRKQSGKRVTFPSDNDIVSGAVEPKDPWRHGSICHFLHVCMCKLTFLFIVLSLRPCEMCRFTRDVTTDAPLLFCCS